MILNMACIAITQSGNLCNRKITEYGVCNNHKKWAWDISNNPLAINFIREYQELMLKLKQASDNLDTKGFNIGKIQSPWGGNLCKQLTSEEINAISDPDLQDYVRYTEESRSKITLAKEFLDPYLAFNLAHGVSYLILGNPIINAKESPYNLTCMDAVRPYMI